MLEIAKVNSVKPNIQRTTEPFRVFTDATPIRIACVSVSGMISHTTPGTILINECRAAFLGLMHALANGNHNILLHTDNILAFLKRGTCHWNMPLDFSFRTVYFRNLILCKTATRVRYIRLARNPADFWSRLDEPEAIFIDIPSTIVTMIYYKYNSYFLKYFINFIC